MIVNQVNIESPVAKFVKLDKSQNNELFWYVAFNCDSVYVLDDKSNFVLKSFKDVKDLDKQYKLEGLYVLTWLSDRITKLVFDDVRTHVPMLFHALDGSLRCDMISGFSGGLLLGYFGTYSLTQVEQIFNYETGIKNHINEMYNKFRTKNAPYSGPSVAPVPPAPPAVPDMTPTKQQIPTSGAEVFRQRALDGIPIKIARLEKSPPVPTNLANSLLSFVDSCKLEAYQIKSYRLEELDAVNFLKSNNDYLIKIDPACVLSNGAIALNKCCELLMGVMDFVKIGSIRVKGFYKYNGESSSMDLVKYFELDNSYKLGDVYTNDITDNDLFYVAFSIIG